MALVSASLDWATNAAELKTYLRIVEGDESENVELELWFTSAVEVAEQFLNNPFADALGADVDLPSSVKLGVFKFVKALRTAEQRADGVTSARAGGVAETYAHPYAATLAFEAARPSWEHWRLEFGHMVE